MGHMWAENVRLKVQYSYLSSLSLVFPPFDRFGQRYLTHRVFTKLDFCFFRRDCIGWAVRTEVHVLVFGGSR